MLTSPRGRRRATRSLVFLVAAAIVVPSTAIGSSAAAHTFTASAAGSGQTVTFAGYQLSVPREWQVVDLRVHPHACLRLDRPAVYVGAAGDQADCPATVVGGAPAVQLQRFGARPSGLGSGDVLTVGAADDVRAVALPDTGPVQVALDGAGVLVSLVYGADDAATIRQVLGTGALLGTARPDPRSPVGSTAGSGAGEDFAADPGAGVAVPGTYQGTGFDTCAAPSQSVMDDWLSDSPYRSVGVYVGGSSRGCAQPNLTASWVARQVASGWHLVPVYVGRQAPCTGFASRMSYDVDTARAQGRTDAADAMVVAGRLGIAAPSSLYADIEGYDSSHTACVLAVISYLSGWTFTMHTGGYQSGVYSSASSGMHDLAVHYVSMGPSRPDDLFMAWWNHREDSDGGPYVPDAKWAYHQRVHQFVGQTSESYGGQRITIDRNYLDVSSSVAVPPGCPTTLDYTRYLFLQWPVSGDQVRTVQCLLATNGFDPGSATGVLNWRTGAALRAFKASRDLDGETTSIGRWAWTALLSAGSTRFLHDGSAGPWVRKVQRALTARLQRVVHITGTYGPPTRQAVKEYQEAVGLPPTGTVGQPTWHALQEGG